MIPLFDGVANNPAAPEFWWTYARLLSSMIPSLVNLTIGGMALTRGIPWLARLLLQWMPDGKAMPEYRQQLAAIGLTTQMFAGVGLGIAAQAFLVGASSSMSCRGMVSTCWTWPGPWPLSICRRG
jgi:hypothetical protein